MVTGLPEGHVQRTPRDAAPAAVLSEHPALVVSCKGGPQLPGPQPRRAAPLLRCRPPCKSLPRWMLPPRSACWQLSRRVWV